MFVSSVYPNAFTIWMPRNFILFRPKHVKSSNRIDFSQAAIAVNISFDRVVKSVI